MPRISSHSILVLQAYITIMKPLEPSAAYSSGRCAPSPPHHFTAPTSRCRSRPRLLLRPLSALPQTKDGTSPTPAPMPKPIDPYRAAGQRLERLLAGVGDGEEELIDSMIMEESVERKLTVALIAGGVLSTGACVVCWVCGLDPLGGASLSLHSLRAAGLGGIAALPVALAKSLLWSDKARSYLPFLEEIQTRQIGDFQAILYELNPWQSAVILGSEVIPGLLILLPAVIGGISKTVDTYFSLSLGPGVPSSSPDPLSDAIAISIAALILGLAKLLELTPSEEEFQTVKDALDNSDRFYQIVGLGESRDALASTVTSKDDARTNAAAFRAVALTWLARRQVAARFAAALAAVEVVVLGAVWNVTGDFTAPCVVGLASAAVDFDNIRRITGHSHSASNRGGGGNSGASTPE